MKYRAGSRRKAIEYEKAITEWWKKNQTFKKSVEQRPIDKSYVFYDGPPFITGNPHHGTLLSSIVKDVVPRFWTMNGYRVERRWGWDCHGLPAENYVEKQLGITDRRDIGTKWSLEDYINKARESMVANSETWRSTIDRVGRWVDFDNCYRTMNKDFMESAWWAFKQLYEAGKIYEGRKVLMYDTKFATPVSKAEVTMDNDAYQTVTDPSAYVKFKLTTDEDSEDGISQYLRGTDSLFDNDREPSTLKNIASESPVYFLAWTTTPWTLMANRALAVNPDMDYIAVKVGDETYIIAESRAKYIFKDTDYELINLTDMSWTGDGPGKGSQNVLRSKNFGKGEGPAGPVQSTADPVTSIKGKDLVGLKYESLDGTICQVFTADFVGADEGTGIVHIAPAYGEDDYELYKKHNTSTADAVGGPHGRVTTLEGDPQNVLQSKNFGGGKVGRTRPEGTAAGPVENRGAIGFVDVLDENGYYLPEYADKLHALGVRDTDEYGIQIWAANKFIAKCLEQKGIIYKIEYIQHEYPFNPRSKERIMYRAFPSWFFDIDGQKTMMLEENENINWFPSYLKHGRFAKNIEAAPDWNLSRDRFWATAMPVWKSKEGTVLVIGSYDELEAYSGKRLDDYHRPWVDEIEFDAYVADGRVFPVGVGDAFGRAPTEHPKGGAAGGKNAAGPTPVISESAHLEHFTRIEKVLDCWFESGSMPFAQLHYPFENKDKFENNYPADFIVEYVGQVRAWFYYVHAVNTALAEIGAFGENAKNGPKNAYKNVITTGTLAGNDGRKMSKSLGNYTDPNVLMDQYSADALRFLLLSSPVLSGEDFALLDKDVSDVHRKLNMIWNVYDFFTTYAEVEGIDSDDLEGFENATIKVSKASEDNVLRGRFGGYDRESEEREPRDDGSERLRSEKNIISDASNPLDTWIVSRLYELRDEITKGMDEYNIPKALENVIPFIDDMSNWFVRRSRRRFSKNDDTEDKNEAFATLYYVLVYLAKLLAPFTPFLAEELYQKMTGSDSSVHLLNWPSAGPVDTDLLNQMSRTRQIITDALALRMQKSDTEDQIKIRQPLSKLTYDGEKLEKFYEQIIAEEVNVKIVLNGKKLELDKTLTPELLEEGRAREIIRAVQSARKHAGLRQDDQIKLSLSCDLPKGHEPFIKTEVGATEIDRSSNYSYDEIAKVFGENVTISLEKI
ncbi:class I tRNA ligase family protein [Candidatus Saccharibacteria bacterium]|nr:class I tRNA ligase family protein [Candidatus Saccharibacteria bacterium]